MKRINLILIIIVIFFLISRLYKISDIPVSLYWDEASIGYNAYSILMTGQDEWGQSYPVHFKAFGEYKLPVYIYTTVLSEAALGLNELAVRLPAVLFSLLSITSLYLILMTIYSKKEVALLGVFLFSVSPWFFIFSRTGYETTAGLAFYLLGIYIYLKVLRNDKLFPLSVLSLVLSAYSYNGFRLLVPLAFFFIFPHYIWYYRQKIKHSFFFLFVSVTLIIISLLPIVNLFSQEKGMSRLEAVGVIESQTNKIEILADFFGNYISHFSPDFLLHGDKNPRSQIPEFGQIFYPDLLFIILGLIWIKKAKNKKYLLPVYLLLIAPIPASITRESPHALRSLLAAPSLATLSALGIVYLSEFFSRKRLVLTGIILVYMVLFFNYYFNFIRNYPGTSARAWQYDYKNLFLNYQNKFNNFDQIIISDRYFQPYIFALFYLSYDPNLFRSQVSLNSKKIQVTSVVSSIGKLRFEHIDFYKFPAVHSLIFADPSEKLTEISEKEIVPNLDGTVSFYVYDYTNN